MSLCEAQSNLEVAAVKFKGMTIVSIFLRDYRRMINNHLPQLNKSSTTKVSSVKTDINMRSSIYLHKLSNIVLTQAAVSSGLINSTTTFTLKTAMCFFNWI